MITVDKSKKRKNGFAWPLDYRQIISWFICVYIVLMFYGTYCVSLINPWSYIVSIFFSIFLIIYLVTSIIVMCIDPAEDASTRKRVSPKYDNKQMIESQYCNICQLIVTCKAKHCKLCNKCVTHFDHHCVWLNTCIGRKNYRLFFVSITSATIGCVYVFVIGLLEFIFSFLQDPSTYLTTFYYTGNTTSCTDTTCFDNLRYYPVVFAAAQLNVWRSFALFTAVLSFVGIFVIGYLVCYHIFLKINNMTTYDHAIKLRASESENSKEKCLTSCLFSKSSSNKGSKTTNKNNNENGNGLNASETRMKQLNPIEATRKEDSNGGGYKPPRQNGSLSREYLGESTKKKSLNSINVGITDSVKSNGKNSRKAKEIHEDLSAMSSNTLPDNTLFTTKVDFIGYKNDDFAYRNQQQIKAENGNIELNNFSKPPRYVRSNEPSTKFYNQDNPKRTIRSPAGDDMSSVMSSKSFLNRNTDLYDGDDDDTSQISRTPPMDNYTFMPSPSPTMLHSHRMKNEFKI